MIRTAGVAGVCMLLGACGAGSLDQPGAQVVCHAPSHISNSLEPGYVNWNDRSDQVSLTVGDAVAHNRVVQYENPWPRYQNKTHIHMDGRRGDLAIDRYTSDAVEQGKAESTN
jgi:hypothetical protein